MLIPILIKGYDTLFVTLICPKLDFPLLVAKLEFLKNMAAKLEKLKNIME